MNRWQRHHGIRLFVLCVAAVSLLDALPARAQEFVKVADGSREQLPATPFIGAAYGFIWVAVLLYLVFVARGLGRVRKDLLDLRRRLDRVDSNAPASTR